MVRRRTRSAMNHKAKKNTASNTVNEVQIDVKTNNCLIGDEYNASPKMKLYKNEKDFKYDSNTAASPVECTTLGDECTTTVKSTVTVNGKYTGTTRSNIRTLDNFFKHNGPVKKPTTRKKKTNSCYTTLCPEMSATLLATIATKTSNNQQDYNWHDFKELPPSDCLYELSNDTNDSEQSNLTDELPPLQNSAVLIPHTTRANMADTLNFPDCCTAITKTTSTIYNTDNIFLQEPVLKLNIDKTPNQASSIKINKSIEVEPKFASRTCPTIENKQLQSCFNNVRLLSNKYLIKEEGTENLLYEQKKLDIKDKDDDLIMLPENDNSSCDSGVVFISSSSSSTIDSNNYISPPPLEHKPTTPHRIVWPSPRRDDSPDNSPRKSQRHNTANCYASENGDCSNINIKNNSKNRRKLNNIEQNASKVAYSKNDDLDNVTEYKSENDIKVKVENGIVVNQRQYSHDDDNDNINDKKKIIDVIVKQEDNKKAITQLKYVVSKAQRTTTNGNRSINEFFPVRRSARKTKTVVKEEMMRNLEKAILDERCDGLKVEYFEGKGRGVVAERHFQRGEFVIEYIGDLISITEATEREARYALDENAGCYMYYFEHKNQQYCIDATEDTGKLGRLVNHSRYGNLLTKVVVVKQTPHLILIAKKDIKPGEELCYDYGDRSKDSLRNHPWLAL